MDDLELTEAEIREGAGLAAISYIFFLWILTFILKRENKFAHYHAKQGLVIFIGEVVCIFLPFLPLLGGVGTFLYKLGMTVLGIFSLYGIYSSLTGKLCKIPVVTNIASKLVI
jgi:uncharacterized membrane protein